MKLIRLCRNKLCLITSIFVSINLIILFQFIRDTGDLHGHTNFDQGGIIKDHPNVKDLSDREFHQWDKKGRDDHQKIVGSTGPKRTAYRYERYKGRNSGTFAGPGENGAGVSLSGSEKTLADELFKKEAFNIVASDKIRLNRTLSDVRHPECKKVIYPKDLPTASVIIVFNNEAWSPLLRTAHSVVNRSPPDHLHEVILLDDNSNRTELLTKLDNYVKETWPDGVVKIIRLRKRSGLILAKLEGARAATGDVLVFLDAHCEAMEGWLEPILLRIKQKRSAVICPQIDSIDAQSMAYYGSGSESVGGFWWSLHFNWRPMPEHERRRRTSEIDPIRSPTMAGGLLAAHREFFFEIGAYDGKMEIWGGENLELSFRTWMCHGSLEFLPCSRVGHIFRSTHPYGFPSKTRDYHGLNSKRLAEVWMDDYKRLYYMHRSDLKTIDVGDLSDRLAIRDRLKCHSFRWYLDHVYPEKFILDEYVVAYGTVQNFVDGQNLCLDTLGKDEKMSFNLALFSCQNGASANQVFSLSADDELRREQACVEVSPYTSDGEVVNVNVECTGSASQKWKYDMASSHITHESTKFCLDSLGVTSGDEVKVRQCSQNSPSQRWTFEHWIGYEAVVGKPRTTIAY